MMRFQRRQRTSFTRDQLDTLHEAFKRSHYPEAKERNELARVTNLEPTRIQVWFQNQRAKDKKRKSVVGPFSSTSASSFEEANTPSPPAIRQLQLQQQQQHQTRRQLILKQPTQHTGPRNPQQTLPVIFKDNQHPPAGTAPNGREDSLLRQQEWPPNWDPHESQEELLLDWTRLLHLLTVSTCGAHMDEMAAKAFGVTSFTTVGHLLHINLKDHLLAHKNEIGQALLSKNTRAKAVVNKVNTINNEYRNFEIEIIAKRNDCDLPDDQLMIVEVNENKCRFKLDFSKVYWNSRLSTEHERILGKLNKGRDIVFDVFAGVGPFSVPAAKAKCRTYANDLNKESVNWLKFNRKHNKVSEDYLKIFNLDAKIFIQDHIKFHLVQEYKHILQEQLATKPRIHIIMNLPALASTFLPNFVGLFSSFGNEFKVEGKDLRTLFKELDIEHIVYCYCFLKGVHEDPKRECREMVENDLEKKLSDEQIIDIFRVRNVAPYKEMYRVDFRLTDSILFGQREIVSIIRNRPLVTNGTSKRVTIQAPNNKRKHDNDDDELFLDSSTTSTSTTASSGVESDLKKPRFGGAGDYCRII